MKTTIIFLGLITLFTSCGKKQSGLTFSDSVANSVPLGQEVTFDTIKSEILSPYCLKCHSDVGTASGLSKWVKPGDVENSLLYTDVKDGSMPKGGQPLPTYDLELIRNYIQQLATSTPPTTPPAPTPPTTPTGIVTFAQIKSAILIPYNCSSCHAVSTESKITRWINTTNPAKSSLYTSIHNGSMPRGGPTVSADKQVLLLQYLKDYAANH